MDKKYNKNLIEYAQELRKNMTKEERELWYKFLKDYPIKFVRQKPLGKYIADFYCAKVKLVVELDGSEHYTDEGIEYDRTRTEYLAQYGIEVLRLYNTDINKNFEGACQFVDMAVERRLKEKG